MTAARSEKINLLFCCNSAYSQHLCVALISVLANNPGQQFDIAVVGRDAFGDEAEKIRRSLAQFSNFDLRFTVFQTPPELALPIRIHYSTDIYTRLWVASSFPDDTARVLYLDSDLIAVGDIAPLWRADLGGKLLGAVDIPGSTRCPLLGIPEAAGYFNSGVLLFDLEQWRRTGAVDEVVRYVAENGDKLIDPDQDALNACFFARRQSLPYIYNVITPFYFQYHDIGIGAAELATIQRQATIVHFNGASKPWHYMSRHPRAADYCRYLRMSEWRDFVPGDRTPLNMVKKFVAGILPTRLPRALGR